MKIKLNNIYNIDCLEGMGHIKDKSVDLVFFDPPFNLNKNYGDNINDNITNIEYIDWQYKLIEESYRVLKDTGSIIYHNIPKWVYKIANKMDDIGMIFQNWICWSESGSLPTPSRLYPKHYPILWFSKTKNKTFNKQYIQIDRCRKCDTTIKDYGGKYKYLKEIDNNKVTILSDVWDDIHRIRHNKNKHRDCNELPIKLMNRIINLYTKEEDVVLDPFAGSGTTLISSKNLNRNYIGFEINDDFIKIINDRLNLSTTNYPKG
jgi:site-specific DNA-methyltransferase (adenine-specific)